MADQYPIQNTFGRGELSPRLHARADIEHWKMAVAELVNFQILRQGGIRRRPGSEDMGAGKVSTFDAGGVLIEYVFSTDQTYVLELSDRAMRVWNPITGLIVNDDGSPYEIVTPWLVQDVDALQYAQSADLMDLVHPLYPPITLSRYGERDWRIARTPLEDGPYEAFSVGKTALHFSGTGDVTGEFGGNSGTTVGWTPGNVPDNAFDDHDSTFWEAAYHDRPADLEWTFPRAVIVTSYSLLSADDTEPDFNNAQAGKVGGFSAPRTWYFQAWDGAAYVNLDQQVGETGWGPNERRYYKFKNEGAYTRYRILVSERNDSSDLRTAVRIKKMQLGGGGDDAGQIVVSATNLVEINAGAGWLPGDVGRQIRVFSDAAYWHWLTILQVNSPTDVVVAVRAPPLSNAKPIALFRLGSFGLVPGYPACVAYFQQRRAYARTNLRPMTLWMSQTANYPNYGGSTPAVAGDGIEFSVTAQGTIAFLAESQELLVGTSEAARVFGSADKNAGFSATNFTQTKSQSYGFAQVRPAVIGDTVMGVGRHRQNLRRFEFSIDQGKYIAEDITVLSEHIYRKGVKRIAFASDPNATIWVLLDDGTMAAITFEPDQKMIAMGRHVLGGGGFVESLCVIPGNGRDELWMMVKRVVTTPQGNVVRRRIERLVSDFEGDTQPVAQAVYLDGSRRYMGAPVLGISGADHLSYIPIQMLADGSEEARLAPGLDVATVVPSMIVTTLVPDSGDIDIPSGKAASVVTVGMPYASRVTTLRMAASQDGSVFGRKVRIRNISVDVQDTRGLFAKTELGVPVEMQLRAFEDPMGSAPPLRTGALDMTYLDDSWRSGGVITLVAVGASPATIRAIVLDVDMEGPEPPLR